MSVSTSPPKARNATTADAAAFAGLLAAATDRPRAEGEAAPDATTLPALLAADRLVLVVEGTSGIDAAIVLAHRADHAAIKDLVVRPARRRLGLGRGLLAIADEVATDHGLATTRTTVPLKALAARATFRAAGCDLDPAIEGATPVAAERFVKRRDQTSSNKPRPAVPIWRDGSAGIGRNLCHRGAWAALSAVVGVGSVCATVTGVRDVTI